MNSKESLPHTLNLPFVEQLYREYKRDAAAVPEDWRSYFAQVDGGEANGAVVDGPSFKPRSIFHAVASTADLANIQDRVDQMVRAYRLRGHMAAQIDPLGRARPVPPELAPSFYGFTDAGLEERVSCDTMQVGGSAKIGQILQRLRNTYTRSIGVEFIHIDDVRIRRWLEHRMEPVENRVTLTRAEQLRILDRLTRAVAFEEFIRRKFLGSKSFSLEGSESLIPLLDMSIEHAAEQGVTEIVFGMAHRGRLNVLANIIGKPERQIFREFMDEDFQRYTGRGDVKYHLGYSNDAETSSGSTVHLSLCFNPSHLEFVNPVAIGRIRAKQDRAGDALGERGLAIVIHGDAALAGEGVVQETLNMSQLPGYSIGGTLHIVVNNQIGFTTGPEQARSTTYATDVFKMLQIPIFHVNGEDPEAVAQCVRLALDFRAEYRRDVVIDMYGYRRLGHNESDEPSFTQPKLYRAIAKQKPVREAYLDRLMQQPGVSTKEADALAAKHRKHLEAEFAAAKGHKVQASQNDPGGVWAGYTGGPDTEQEPQVTISSQRLAELLAHQTKLPTAFAPHPKLKKLLDQRQKMAAGEAPLDWASAEALAFATLATAYHPVRLSGQDAERGTFSHRHAVLHEHNTGETYVPLQHASPDQARVDIVNSPLSEVGVLAFEYGYSLDRPEALVLWEAQFGDFWNAAQVIVDQFIASAEAKWNRLSGLVLLLPHGLEGQGPEHSSARMERFLELAAEDNLQVVYPTTPAQYYHLLRRQVLRSWRKPLIVLSPKSLLRHPRVVSTLDELADGSFQRIIPDGNSSPRNVKRVLLCSGKLFYELDEHRTAQNREDIAILRIEQLYPLHVEHMDAALGAYRSDTPVFWVQEEPQNMGAWRHMLATFGHTLVGRFPFHVISRPASATPATGSHASHEREQKELIQRAFDRR